VGSTKDLFDIMRFHGVGLKRRLSVISPEYPHFPILRCIYICDLASPWDQVVSEGRQVKGGSSSSFAWIA
jgi:hypothetical protein